MQNVFIIPMIKPNLNGMVGWLFKADVSVCKTFDREDKNYFEIVLKKKDWLPEIQTYKWI